MQLFKVKVTRPDPDVPGETFSESWTEDFADSFTAVRELQDQFGLDAKIEVSPVAEDKERSS